MNSIYANLVPNYIILHKCTSGVYQRLNKHIKNDNIHVDKIQERHFIEQNKNLRSAPQPREGLLKLKTQT